MSQEQQVFGWESVIGQNQLTDNLQNALKFNKIFLQELYSVKARESVPVISVVPVSRQ